MYEYIVRRMWRKQKKKLCSRWLITLFFITLTETLNTRGKVHKIDAMHNAYIVVNFVTMESVYVLV